MLLLTSSATLAIQAALPAPSLIPVRVVLKVIYYKALCAKCSALITVNSVRLLLYVPDALTGFSSLVLAYAKLAAMFAPSVLQLLVVLSV